jgi:hypothetical protein
MKTFSVTDYYRGVEIKIICVTTSKKKFAELVDMSLSYINSYAHSYDLRYPICNENPNKLYAKPGMGGEAIYIFKREEIKTLEKYKELIKEHREKYPTRYDYEKRRK